MEKPTQSFDFCLKSQFVLTGDHSYEKKNHLLFSPLQVKEFLYKFSFLDGVGPCEIAKL